MFDCGVSPHVLSVETKLRKVNASDDGFLLTT